VFGLEGESEISEMRVALSRLMAIGDSRLSGILLLPPLQRSFPGSPWRRFLTQRVEVDRLLFAKIRARRAELARGPAQHHVLDLMLTAVDEAGNGLSDQEVRDELMTLLIAGHETTATSLCWTLERLLDNPAVLGRLQAELEMAPPEPEALTKLPYLDAVLREALRLRPVVPLVGRRLLAPLTLGQHRLEAGTVVAPNIYMTGRLERVFPDPEAFRPERFLSDRPAPWEWFPFGGGTRRCLGMAFALYEMKVVLGTLLLRYDFARTRSAPVRAVRRGIILAPRGRSLLNVARRAAARTGATA
jgi:cytochrome P450